MRRYLFFKVLQAPVVFLLVITLSFFMMRMAPGGPFDRERSADPAIQKALEARFHLDKALHQQYYYFLEGLIHGDLGPSSCHLSTSVNEIIARGLPPSAILGILAFSLALLAGVTAGVIAALNQGSRTDLLALGFCLIGLSVPTFVVAPLLQLLFSIHLNFLPVAGYHGLASPHYLILPALTLALPFAARIARLTRTGMLEVLNQDYITTARAKGLKTSTIVFKHCLRSGLLPVASFIGPAAASILTGSLVVEYVFNIPGLGREFIEGALNRDYTLVMGTVVVYCGVLILFNLLSDLLLAWMDPRIRFR